VCSLIGRHSFKAAWAKTFIALLLAAHGGQAWADPAPRPFQMVLWDSQTRTDSDLPWFYENWTQPQPPGRAVLQLAHWKTATVASLNNLGFDWSRIAAVVIDEPYLTETGGASWTNPCRKPNDGRLAKITALESTIRGVADAVKVVSKNKTRFWINFSEQELQWMMDGGCPVPLNQPYIHVISLDKYAVPFADEENFLTLGYPAWSVKPYYDWLLANQPPQQQLALVPGTFFRVGHDDPYVIAWYLLGFFDYAATLNRRCDLELGSTGVTGNYDRCRVWAVVGWTVADSVQDGPEYRTYNHPLALPIAVVWRTQFAVPQRAAVVSTLLNHGPLND
jgi:hypothetical protein